MIRLIPMVFLVACGSGDVPDFRLEDVNASSPSFGERIGPADFEGEVSAWYFGWATCPICQRHVDALDPMGAELAAASPSVPITLLGINEVGRESANGDITEGVDMPWLQDTTEVDVFGTWPPDRLRELKIVGPGGEVVRTFDLNDEDPDEAEHYDAIKQALLDAAASE